MKITLTIDVPKLATTKDAQEYGRRLAEWVVECPINEDASIQGITSTVHNIKKGSA